MFSFHKLPDACLMQTFATLGLPTSVNELSREESVGE